MELSIVSLEIPEDANLILGQAHFIKTVEDLHEALASSSPRVRFGIAFCESSGDRLVRKSGNDPELVGLAARNGQRLGTGHAFLVLMREGFPVSVLNAIKALPTVCGIFCATANPVQVILVHTDQGRGILGVVDGGAPAGVENEAKTAERKALLRTLGYKL
jgi:adenosine/AMP kinase